MLCLHPHNWVVNFIRMSHAIFLDTFLYLKRFFMQQ